MTNNVGLTFSVGDTKYHICFTCNWRTKRHMGSTKIWKEDVIGNAQVTRPLPHANGCPKGGPE